jgi:hypothetical protein|tara:strand:+ start:6718 stop:7182 length:465 start_codon:yes stop_codon:yes gene_type:complete
MKDLSNNIVPVVSIINAVKTAAANGTGVDLQGYESATVLVDVGAEGDTLSSSVYFELSLEESDDDSTYTDVVQADIVDGTIASGGIFLKLDGTTGGDPDSSGGIFRVGYVGNKRYIRVVLAKTGTHSNGTPIGAMVVKGHARHSDDNAFTAHNA